MSQLIDPDRLLSDLRMLRSFGSWRTGVHRPTYSPQDMEARHWLCSQMKAAGLSTTLDGIGNILGCSPVSGTRLLLGSHCDSQDHAGWLDGALGVICALEIARSFLERRLPNAVDAAVWADEEARFASFLGSRAAIGQLDAAEVAAAIDRTTSEPLSRALEAAGLGGRPFLKITAEDYLGYLELHIEQGDHLDSSGLRLGVVTAIVGILQLRITVTGQRNHAGTTSMIRRRDAARSLIALATQIEELLQRLAGERTVWTVGDIRVEPGQVSIIPDHAELMLQVRDADAALLDRVEVEIQDLVSRVESPCATHCEVLSRTSPCTMAEPIQEVLMLASEAVAPDAWVKMPSGAGHDAQILAQVMPAGMLFVPSIGGISHHWQEDTAEADIVTGCIALADACYRLFQRIEG